MDCASGDTFCGGDVNFSLENIFVADAVITRSLVPLKRDGADKLGKALERFRREDPTFRVFSDEETGETLIAGMGQLHLDIYVERIKREYKVECEVGPPRVAYKERPTRNYTYDYKHKKQTGGSGQYAHVKGELQPMTEEEMNEAEEPFEFVNEVTQGRIPREYIPAVEKGLPPRHREGTAGRVRGRRRADDPQRRVVPRRRLLRDGLQHRRLRLHAGGAPDGLRSSSKSRS